MYSGSTAPTAARSAPPSSAVPSGAVRCGAGRCGGHVGDQPLVARLVLPDHRHRLADPRRAGQRRLHLAELDPEPPHLHLVIGAGHELELSVIPPARQVPGPVHPLARAPERAGDEPLRGQARPSQVPPGQTRPGDVQVARHSRRHQPQPLIKHEHPAVAHRSSDWRIRRRPCRQRIADQGGHGSFGGTVAVDHHPSRRPLVHQGGRARFSAGVQHPEPGQRPGRQAGQRRGRDLEVADGLVIKEVDQLAARHDQRWRDH